MINRLSKLLISIIFFGCYNFYRKILYVVKKQNHGGVVVLCYHEVTSKQRKRFTRQMNYLKKLVYPVAADFTKIKNGVRNAAITFDDGFQCLLENAIPELRQRKIPAAIFIPSGNLGMNPGWIDNKQDKNYSESIMTSEQLKALPKDLITIGSHCVTHPDLTLIGEKKAKGELFKSKMDLEKITGREVNILAFPYSAHNQKIVEWAKQAGYKYIFSGQSTFSSQFLTGRISVSPDDWPIEFQLKLLGAYQWLPFVIAIKRRLRKYFTYILCKRKSTKDKSDKKNT